MKKQQQIGAAILVLLTIGNLFPEPAGKIVFFVLFGGMPIAIVAQFFWVIKKRLGMC